MSGSADLGLDRVLAKVLHDLRAPVRHMKQYAHFALAGPDPLPADVAHKIKVISSSAASLDRMVDNLFALCRTSLGSDRIADVSLETVVNQAILHLRLEIQERNALIIFRNLPRVRGVEGLLISAFQNLIMNGLKFNRSRYPHVEITAVSEQGRVVVSLADNGVGIPAKFLDGPIEWGQGLDHGGVMGGAGVGLAIVKRIVDFHNGEIWFEANDNGSTRVKLAFAAAVG